MDRNEALKVVSNIHHTEKEFEALQVLIPDLKENGYGENLIEWLEAEIAYYKKGGEVAHITALAYQDVLSHITKRKNQ